MPPKVEKLYSEADITTEGVGSSNPRKSQDLVVRAIEDAERAGIPRKNVTRDATQAVFMESFKAYLKQNCCCGDQSSDSESPAQSPFEVLHGKATSTNRPTGTQVEFQEVEIELESKRTERFQDAQHDIWEGSLNKEKVVHLMKTDKVVSMETIVREGTTGNPAKVTLESGIIGIFKGASLDDSFSMASYRHEIAAYEIDKLLGLNMVPLTVERELGGEKGSLQLWVNNLTNLETPLCNDGRFFDWLIANTDRGLLAGHNFGYRTVNGLDQAILYDNAIAFLPVSWEPPDFEMVSSLKPEKSNILEKARNLDRKTLEPIKCLSQQQKDNLLDRRDKLVDALDRASIEDSQANA